MSDELNLRVWVFDLKEPRTKDKNGPENPPHILHWKLQNESSYAMSFMHVKLWELHLKQERELQESLK